MKFKKILFVSILLLAILTIGAVSASDGHDSDNLTVSNEQTSLDVDKIAVVEDEENLTDEYEYYGDNYEVIFEKKVDIDDEYSDLVSYNFNDEMKGSVAIHINGSEVYNASDNLEGKVVWLYDLNIDNLDYGTYKVDFIYSGDETNDGFVKSADVEFTYGFDVYPADEGTGYTFGHGEDVEFYAHLPSIEGSIEYVVNGKKYTVSRDDYIIVKAQDLKMGQNNITFSYIPVMGPVNTDNCLIYIKYLVKFIPLEIPYDGATYVTLELPSDAKGDLNLYEVKYVWDDDWGDVPVFTLIKNIKVENGIVNESLSGLSPGYHKIYANYTGSDYEVSIAGSEDEFEGGIITASITVVPKVIFPSKVWENGVYDCEFLLPENYNGVLTVEVAGKEKTYNVTNGKGKFVLNVSEFDDMGEFYLLFDGEDYVYSNYFYPEIIVQNPETELELNEQDYQFIVKGKESYYASFNIENDNVKVYVDDVYYDVSDCGYIYIETGNLTLGKHDVRFEVSGDDYYAPSTAHDSFNVTYINFYIPDEIIIGEYYGSSSTASVVVAEDVTGEAKLIVDGVESESEKITGSNVYFHLNSLSYGNHTLTLAYQNGNYASSSKTVKVNAEYRYYLEIGDLIYGDGEAAVYLPNDATGDVKIIINGKEFSETVKDGKATFHIEGIPTGIYEATVTYSGDKKYPAQTAKYNTTVYYQINQNFRNDVFVDNLKNALITLCLPEDAKGNLTVYFEKWDDDIEDYVSINVASSALKGGKAQIPLSEFIDKSSSYVSFTVKYDGDDYEVEDYDSSVEIKQYDVIRPDDEEHILIGQNFEYKIKVPQGLKGYLQVYAGKDYKDLILDNVAILNGVATIPLKYDEMGLWGIKIIYVGSDYEIEDYERFIVWPDNVTLASTASGDDVAFTVQMPEDSSGNVTIMISRHGENHENKEICIPYTGTAVFKASDIPAGYWCLNDFNVTSDKYGFFRFSFTTSWWASGFYDYFKIMDSKATKIDPKLSVNVDDIEAGQSAVVKIALNETISGSVLLSVGGSNYTVPVQKGVGSMNVSGLAVGTYDAVVYYEGSEYFAASQKTASFKVNEAETPAVVDPNILASNVNAVYSAGSYYTIKVYGNDGKLADGVTVKITGKISKTLKTSKGVAKFKINQAPGKYKITINALGKKVTKTIKVKHIVKLYTATLKKSAKKLTLKATLAKVNGKYLKKKTVTFKINGKKVATAKTNSKGVAKITIKNPKVVKKLKVGKKATYQATYLKDTIKKTAKIKK